MLQAVFDVQNVVFLFLLRLDEPQPNAYVTNAWSYTSAVHMALCNVLAYVYEMVVSLLG
jgi:hypothetical protein